MTVIREPIVDGTRLPDVFHMLSDDGLALHSVYAGSGGTIDVMIGWTDVETAEANHLVAAASFEHRLSDLRRKLAEERNAKQAVFHVGAMRVFVSIGPPTWWKPDLGLRLRGGFRFRAGWLRAAIQISHRPDLRTPNPTEEPS
jgi:hypothetical protein